MNGTLRLGSNDALYILVGNERFAIRPEEIQPLLFHSHAVPVRGEGRASVGHAAVNAASRAVKIFTVAGHFIVPGMSFHRVVVGAAISAAPSSSREALRGCGHPDYFDNLAKCIDAAAALSTVATMGREQFTIKTLREAFDLSYHQTRRTSMDTTTAGRLPQVCWRSARS